jgi:phosphate-selective porin OprO and OprP
MTKHLTSLRTALALGALATTAASPAHAQSRDEEIQLLREQIRQLDQKLRVLERKSEIKDEEATAAAKAAPKVTVNDRGFTVASADNAHSLRLRGLVQADSRWYLNDEGLTTNDAFVLRRARIIFEGAFNKFVQFQLVPEYGGGAAGTASAFSLLDANVTLNFAPQFQLKFGKFKSPVGLEQLQSDSWAFFAERSLVTNLVPNRDVGVQLGGALFGGTLEYQAGLFNGAVDGGNSGNSDNDDDKELAGRVFAFPFKNGDSPLKGLGIGVAGTYSNSAEGTAGRTAGYRSEAQQTFFAYGANTVADGDLWRITPQAYWYSGPVGVLAEYAQSVHNVRVGATKAELKHDAWQLAAGYVLTGEDSSFAGVAPRQSFSWGNGTWGAFEVVGRVSQLDVDDATFPTFAAAASNATKVSAYSLGLNWYLTRTLRATIDYFHSEFDTAVPTTSPLLANDEDAVFTRLQLNF